MHWSETFASFHDGDTGEFPDTSREECDSCWDRECRHSNLKRNAHTGVPAELSLRVGSERYNAQSAIN
jgi:hypothetical protein